MKVNCFLLLVVIVLSSCDVFTQQKDKNLNEFLILGTLNDYMGRRLDPRHEDLLERYSSPESALMTAVDSLLKVTYSKEVYNNVVKTKNAITSNLLAKRLNEFYNFEVSDSSTGSRKEILTGKLKDNIFKNEEQKLTFLAGVFLRFGSISDTAYCISMGNSASKIQMCNSLLKEFDCEPYYEILHNIPKIHTIYFHPTPKVLAYLKRYEPLRKQIKDSEEAFIQNILDERRRKRSLK